MCICRLMVFVTITPDAGEGNGTAFKTDIVNIFTVQPVQAVNEAGEGAGTAYKTDINIFTVNVFRYRQ